MLFLLLAVWCTPASAGAASPWANIANPVFVRADTRELPEAAVMSLAQDSTGFLWVGTQGGLARYDGYRFRSFLPNPADPAALPDGYVRTMLADPTGGVWIGSSSNGLVHFDPKTETFHTWHRDRAGATGPRSGSVDAIAEEDGALWVGGDGGLDRFDPATGAFHPIGVTAKGAQPIVLSLMLDRSGTLWAGTEAGLFYRPRSASAFRAFSLDSPAPVVYSLLEDRAGRVWAGSENSLYDIAETRRTVASIRTSPHASQSLAPGQQWTLIEIANGSIWAGTDSAISIVDAATLRVHRVRADAQFSGGLTGGRLMQFLRDRSGLVWAANHVGGLLSYNPLSTGLYEISATRTDVNVGDKGAVAVSAAPDHHLWIGGFSGTIVNVDANAAHATALNYPNAAAIQSLYQSPGGALWFGTTTGLCRLTTTQSQPVCSKAPQIVGQSAYALLPAGRNLWVGGSNGLFLDDAATGKLTPYPRPGTPRFSNNQVRVLYNDRRQRLWVGTENGLYRFDPSGKIARFLYAPGKTDAIGPGGMASILEDRRGRIWAGANGGPLNVLEEDAAGNTHFRFLGIADGLPHENVDGLAEGTDGRIWASTDKGIAAIDPVTLHARAFGAADGISDGAYWAGSVSKAVDGTMFFGGIDGVAVVSPDAGSLWINEPPVVISALHVGRRAVPSWRGAGGEEPVDSTRRRARHHRRICRARLFRIAIASVFVPARRIRS